MLGGRPNKSQRILALAGLAKRILFLTLFDSHSNLTREAKTGSRLTVPSSRQKSEPNGSRERLLLDSCSMLSQRLPSWAASPPVGRCSLGDSFTHYSRQHAPEALATIAWLRGSHRVVSLLIFLLLQMLLSVIVHLSTQHYRSVLVNKLKWPNKAHRLQICAFAARNESQLGHTGHMGASP